VVDFGTGDAGFLEAGAAGLFGQDQPLLDEVAVPLLERALRRIVLRRKCHAALLDPGSREDAQELKQVLPPAWTRRAVSAAWACVIRCGASAVATELMVNIRLHSTNGHPFPNIPGISPFQG